MKFRVTRRRMGVLAVAAVVLVGVPAAPAMAAARDDSTQQALRMIQSIGVAGANRHLIALQRIADANGGTRAVGTPGYDASVKYVADKLTDAGYIVSTPEFDYDVTVVDAASVVAGGAEYDINKIALSADTPVGGITAPLLALPAGDPTPGCEAADYAGLAPAGTIVLISRGFCTFRIKTELAASLGAVAVVIANNVDLPLVNVTLGEGPTPATPVGGVTLADGATLAGLSGSVATVDMREHVEVRTSRNVIAQTTTGRTDNVVMAGAHLDSVPAGPGINDNGTGSAGLLEIALKAGSAPPVNNAVRFAWWGAEEEGLLGSTAWVNSLDFEQQLDIALYLNFDMIGSPNAAYFVYDGDNSLGTGAPGPYGSAQIEQTFTDFFTNWLGVPTEPTAFDGRSDYGQFIEVGIPAGGLFTGAEDIKTEAQAALWGGTAGIAYDPCYHQACDNLGNIDRVAFGRNILAAAYATAVYALSTEGINGVPSRALRAEARAAAQTMAVSAVATDGKAAA